MIGTRQSILTVTLGMDMTTNANWIHKFDQAIRTFRHIAEILAAFRRSPIEGGFTEEGAEELMEKAFDLLVRDA